MMFTILSASAFVAVVSGTAIIAKAAALANGERVIRRGGDKVDACSCLFSVLDDQRIETFLGLSLIVFGSVLLLVHIAGVVLPPAAVIILASVVLIFLVAHARYARQLRTTQRERFTAMLERVFEAGSEEDALTSGPRQRTLLV